MPQAPRLQPALYAGAFIGVLSALPFVNIANCCCLWVISGGVLLAFDSQAESSGHIGEQVTVKNPISGQRFRGVVEDKGKVIVRK